MFKLNIFIDFIRVIAKQIFNFIIKMKKNEKTKVYNYVLLQTFIISIKTLF